MKSTIGSVAANTILTHPAFTTPPVLGGSGYELDNLDNLVEIEVSVTSISTLESLGIRVLGTFGLGNKIWISTETVLSSLHIHFSNRNDNMIFIGRRSRLSGSIRMEGDRNIVVSAGNDQNAVSVNVMMRYHEAGVFLGSGGSCPPVGLWVEGPGRSIIIGSDFMLSWGVWIRTADSHALVDLATGTVINESKSVLIEQHVWLGQDVIVMPGVKIGTGSVAGARSIVTSEIPPCSVAVGAPARVRRSGTSWTRSASPKPEAVSALQSRFCNINLTLQSD